MNLGEMYKVISQSIVAIAVCPPAGGRRPEIPRILGTGFVVAEGLIATNDHVVQLAGQIPRPTTAHPDDWPIEAVVFCAVSEVGMYQVPLEVIGAFTTAGFNVKGYYYGPPKPDIGFLHVKAKGLPRLKVVSDLKCIEPGTRLATAGFPMGTDALCAPGYLHQMTPTLQEGIVSAVLPFPCPTPHAFMLNVMAQGGASGSPVFLQDDPAVVGILYGSLNELYFGNVQGVQVPYKVPTMFSYCVPGHFLQRALDNIHAQPELALPPDTMTLDEMLAKMPKHNAGRHLSQ